MAEGQAPRERWVRDITAEQLDASVIGEVVALPAHSYDTMVGGELIGFSRTGTTFVVRVRSEADGRVSRYRLFPADEIRVYSYVPEISDQA